jgi:hypothetical protein
MPACFLNAESEWQDYFLFIKKRSEEIIADVLAERNYLITE